LEKEKEAFEEKKKLEREARLKKEQEEREAAEREKERLAAIEAEKRRKARQLRLDLKSPNPRVRFEALKVVAKSTEKKDAIGPLIELLARKDVRHEAGAVLAQIGQDAVPALVKALRNEDLYVRYEAILALRDIGSKEAVPALKKLGETDPSSLVRSAARKTVEKMEE
jgi:HEAT repeat protein